MRETRINIGIVETSPKTGKNALMPVLFVFVLYKTALITVFLQNCRLYIEKQYGGFCRLIIITLRNCKKIWKIINRQQQFITNSIKNYQSLYFNLI
jgi:hypothetical protein